MNIVSSCKAIRLIESLFEHLEKNKVSELVFDSYKDDVPNYTHIYKTLTDNTDGEIYVKTTFKYDRRNGDKAVAEISERGLQEIFDHLSFYTILKLFGIEIFDKHGKFNEKCLKQISEKIFDLTGKEIELKWI